MRLFGLCVLSCFAALRMRRSGFSFSYLYTTSGAHLVLCDCISLQNVIVIRESTRDGGGKVVHSHVAALAVARSILESLEGPESGLSSTTTGPTPGSRIR